MIPKKSRVKETTTHSQMDNPVISIQTSYATINLKDKCPQELMINSSKALRRLITCIEILPITVFR